MAKVPYSGVPEVAPANRAAPAIGVDTPLAAFGGASAQATGELGKQLERSGDELFQRAIAMQQLANTSEASEANTGFMIASGDLRAKYGALQGKDAVTAYPKFTEDMKALEAKFSSTLSNPMSRRMFDQESRGTMARTIFSAAGHSATENKQWAVGTAKAQVATSFAKISENPNDDVEFQSRLKDIEANTRHYSSLEAGDDGGEITKYNVLKNTSNAIRTRVEGIARKEPGSASKMLESYRSRMTEDDFDKADKAVQLALVSKESKRKGSEINADLSEQEDPKLPEKTLDERVKQARDWSKREYPGNSEMEEATVTAVRNGYSSYKRDVADARVRNLDTMQEALQTNIGGKLPTSREELFVSDKARATYLKLSAADQRKVLHALDLNAKDDVAESEATYALYHKYVGMSRSDDPVVRKEFLETFFPAEKDLPRKRRDQLDKLQTQVRKSDEANPHVMAGMRMLTDAGLAPRMDQDKEGALVFRGMLQESLDALHSIGQKPPTTLEEWKKIGSTLRMQVPGSGIFTDYRIYEVPVPSNVKSDLKTLYPNITDEQAQREYGKLRFMEAWKTTYGKAKAK